MGATLSLVVSIGAQDIANNRTSVTVDVNVTSTGSTWNMTDYEPVSLWGSFSASGSSKFGYQTTTRLLTTTQYVNHNADGTGSYSFGASYVTGVSPGTIYAYASGSLPTIPRASQISATDATTGGTSTVTVTPYASFYDEVTVTFGSLTQSVSISPSTGSGTKTGTISVTDDWLKQIPNAASGTATVTVNTYTDSSKGTSVGSRSSTFTVTARDYSSDLTAAFSSITETATLPSAFSGKWVQTLSKPRFVISNGGYKDSTVSSIYTTFDGISYSGTPVTASAIASSGTLTATTVVTDSRGKSKTATSSSMTVYAYHKPQVNVTAVASGSTCTLHIVGSISAVGNSNTRAITIAWTNSSGGSGTIASSLSSYDFDYEVTHSDIDSSLTYEYTITVTDANASTVATAKTGIILMSRHAGGDGVTFGAEAQLSGLRIANDWDVVIQDDSGDMDLRHDIFKHDGSSVTQTAYSVETPSARSASIDMIGGKSVVWNQLVGSSTTSVTLTSGHKYFTDISGTESIQAGAGSAVSVTGGTDMVIDLTQMFGSGNEPSTVAEFNAMFPADYYDYNAGEVKSAVVDNVNVVGKNLFDADNATKTTGYITSARVIETTDATNTTYILSCLPNTTYTISVEDYIASTRCRCASWNAYPVGSATTNMQTINAGSEYIFTITTSATDKYIAFSVKEAIGTTAEESFRSSVQVERGSTATTYSAYTSVDYAIPSAIQALDGYGWSAGSVYNYVDFANKKYHKCVGSYTCTGTENVDVGASLGTYNRYQIEVPFATSQTNLQTLWEIGAIRKYAYSEDSFHYYVQNGKLWFFTDKTTVAEVLSQIQGSVIYYELATEVVTDISAELDGLSVTSGGSVTFHNSNGDDYCLPVPNTIDWSGNPLEKRIEKLEQASGVPTGTIVPYAASTAPSGWLICDGSAVSRTTYASLYAVIGTTYGVGDGSTTFNLPNLQGKVPVGVSSTDGDFDLADTGGEKTHTLSTNEMPSHSHYMSNRTMIPSGSASYLGVASGSPYDYSGETWTSSAGSSYAHNNLQPYIALNYIICI